MIRGNFSMFFKKLQGTKQILLFVALCFIAGNLPLWANDYQSWTDYFQNYHLPSGVDITTNIGTRTRLENTRWGQVHTEARFGYTRNELIGMYVSGRLFYNYFEQNNDILEIRPTAALKLNWPDLTYFSFNHQLRYEYRMHWGVELPIHTESNRVRFKVQTISSQLLPNSKHPVKVFFWNEAFFPWLADESELFRDKNRMCAGIQLQMNNRLKLKCGYIIQSTRDEKAESLAEDTHIIQFTFIRN